jgi:hypothetical protein
VVCRRACAYGIDPLVERLVENGADVNARNSYGFSCIHEACHRGYADIVKSLLRGNKVDLAYLPPDEACFQSPFASAPPQTALGEAARCGFFRIVQTLLDAGAPKNQRNRLGWTPLHEACFYHRIETVKTLLLAGADASMRTNKGALPYHLAGLQEIRLMLQDMGGSAAVPSEHDLVDMVDILTELTLGSEGGSPEGQLDGDSSRAPVIIGSGSHTMPVIVIGPRHAHVSEPHTAAPSSSGSHTQHHVNESKASRLSIENSRPEEEKLLHSGKVLGDLPSLSPGKSSPTKIGKNDVEAALHMDSKTFASTNNNNSSTPSHRADDKHPKTKKKNKKRDEVPADIPSQYLCQLTQRPMSDPVKTIYGNFYDRTAITQWMKSQGRICPLTGEFVPSTMCINSMYSNCTYHV